MGRTSLASWRSLTSLIAERDKLRELDELAERDELDELDELAELEELEELAELEELEERRSANILRASSTPEGSTRSPRIVFQMRTSGISDWPKMAFLRIIFRTCSTSNLLRCTFSRCSLRRGFRKCSSWGKQPRCWKALAILRAVSSY